MRKRLLRAALLTSTLGLVVVAAIELSLPSLASTTRRSMAPRVESAEGAVTPSQGIADSDTLVDLNLAPAPTPSRVVLAERLHVLGATPEAALGAVSLIDAGAPATGAIAALGLETSHSAKAESLVAAYLGHRPVAFEGFDMGPEVEGFVAQSIAAGVDPDEAGWMALQARSKGWPRTRDAAALGALAGTVTSDARLVTSIVSAGLHPEAVPVRSQEVVAIGQLDSSPGPITVIPAAFTCKTCPNPDYVLTPTTTCQVHPPLTSAPMALEAGGCRIYRFTVAAGKRYRFSLCPVECGASATFDSVLEAYNTTCQFIKKNDDFCGTASQLTVPVTAAGYIYVKVYAKNGDAGEYRLSYQISGTVAAGSCTTCPSFDVTEPASTSVYQVTGTMRVRPTAASCSDSPSSSTTAIGSRSARRTTRAPSRISTRRSRSTPEAAPPARSTTTPVATMPSWTSRPPTRASST